MLANPSLEELARILRSAKTIAVVGCSPRRYRPSHEIAEFLIDRGYEVIPVNPGHDQLLGVACYPSVAAIPRPVDIVDVFRRPEFMPETVADAIAARAKVIWMQDGIFHDAAAASARAHGIVVVQDRCIMRDCVALLE
ncbi:MAG: CoA-binding protein [Planctomycetota bacterium]